MGGVDPDKLAALPGLYKALMGAPLVPMLRGFLPERAAVYVLYEHGHPFRVGSPPHLDENLLRASVRIEVSIFVGSRAPGPLPRDPHRFSRVLHARWIKVDDPLMRLMLETYVGQALGVTVSDPRLIEAMLKPQTSTMQAPAPQHEPV